MPLSWRAKWPLMSEWSLGLPPALSNMPHAGPKEGSYTHRTCCDSPRDS